MTKEKDENRIDRIERLAEEMFAGIAQLRESQATTDEQIRELRESQAKADEQIRKAVQRIREVRKSMMGYPQGRKGTQRKVDEEIPSLKKCQARTDAQMRRTDLKLDRIGKQLWDLGLVRIDAKDLFYRNLKGAFKRTKMDIKKVKRNLKRKGEGEYDLVAVDGGQVLVVEVKNKLDKRMVDKFLEEKLPRFKALFPEYEKYQVVGHGGLGGKG